MRARSFSMLLIANQIDYLGGMPTTTAKPVKVSENARQMLRFDLDNENETIRNYRQAACGSAKRGSASMPSPEHPQNSVQEQEHQNDGAMVLGVDVPDVTKSDEVA